jgi:hypothetical protein
MFLSRSLGRKKQRRRERVRLVPTPDSGEDWCDLDDMLGALSQWAASMPWVSEQPGRERDTLTLFMIDCIPLSCHEPWFAITARGDEVEGGPGVVVTLPDRLGPRTFANGWKPRVKTAQRGRYLKDVQLPACEQELLALQQLLKASYASAFDSPG